MFWHRQALIFFGYDDKIEESQALITSLQSESEREKIEERRMELRELQAEEERKAEELEAARQKLRAWETDRTSPVVVIRPPPLEDTKPLTFKEWTAKLGVEAREFEGKEGLEPWEALGFFDCDDYALYLEKNDYEYQLDEFRAQVDVVRHIWRKCFRFDPAHIYEDVPKREVPLPEGILGWREWRRSERLGVIKWSEERMKATSAAERYERNLSLYGEYVAAKSEYWSKIFLCWWTADTASLRKKLNDSDKSLDPERPRPDSAATEESATANKEPIASENSTASEEPTADEEEPPPRRRQWKTASRWIGNACLPVAQASSSDEYNEEEEEEGEEEEEPIVEEPIPDEPNPMTFLEWSTSPLAPQDPKRNKNTDSTIRSDLKAYISYLGSYTHYSVPLP
jgi:hypothetical protein